MELQKYPMYKNILDDENVDLVDFRSSLKNYENTMMFCLECNLVQSFSKNGNLCDQNGEFHLGYREIKYRCSHNMEHTMCIYLYSSPEILVKIGQYPSISSFDINEFVKQNKFINKKVNRLYKSELMKAISCNTHELHGASFLYIRRVFENIVHNIIGERNPNFDLKTKMQDKLKELGNLLPEVNELPVKRMYGMFSKAVHEMKEDECSKNYEIAFTSIIYLLEIVDQENSRKEKLANVNKSLGN